MKKDCSECKDFDEFHTSRACHDCKPWKSSTDYISRAEPTVIRSKTLMPTKDFKEWAKRVRETNPNAVVIPCDAEVVSSDAVQGEWIRLIEYVPESNESLINFDGYQCSVCGGKLWADSFNFWNYCPICGARMCREDVEA